MVRQAWSAGSLATHGPIIWGLHRISSLDPTLCWTRVEDIYNLNRKRHSSFVFQHSPPTDIDALGNTMATSTAGEILPSQCFLQSREVEVAGCRVGTLGQVVQALPIHGGEMVDFNGRSHTSQAVERGILYNQNILPTQQLYSFWDINVWETYFLITPFENNNNKW